jgi:hypothetical protein
MTLTTSQTNSQQIHLTVFLEGHRMERHMLVEGATMMVGSGANCGIRLKDSAISSIHCVLRFSNGELLVQDWCSTLGTFVNGHQVEEETVVKCGTRIRIGRFELLVEQLAYHAPVTVEEQDVPRVGGNESAGRKDYGGPIADRVTHSENLDGALAHDDAVAERDASTVRDVVDASTVDHDSCQARVVACAGIEQADHSQVNAHDDRQRARALLLQGIDLETVGLLQSEIECLQAELSERDRQLAELQELVDGTPAPEPTVDSSETEALVGRLEQLLEELQDNDQRIRVLEELIQAEQELTRTQQEERQQIESWLNDIERRLAARDQESQAERDALLRRVEQLKAERDEADRQVQAAEQSPQAAALQQSIVRELRGQVDRLQDELEQAERRRQTMEKALDELKSKDPEKARDEYIEGVLREERLKLAQEKAALSRERAQMARRLAELDGTANVRERSCEADDRFRAFRQTLKELHRQEQRPRAAIKKASLGTRISDLWRKLDGPTDTD